ncbi:hypothetical protein [Promicromonospora sp. NPDC090134]|uniref:hypothetical protein n=1 Tax=Promicromonospora sp. NPDC090134 TaxID=3364408 RepID=UPI00382B61BD
MIPIIDPAPSTVSGAQVEATPSRPDVTTAEDHQWEAAVLAAWSGADVVGVETCDAVRAVGLDVVRVVEVVMTVRTTHDARTLAALLDLPAALPDPDVAWQTWTGWVSKLSAARPVLVTVTAPTTRPEA